MAGSTTSVREIYMFGVFREKDHDGEEELMYVFYDNQKAEEFVSGIYKSKPNEGHVVRRIIVSIPN